tara:strand:- start:6973 stop:7596 length:624 start_codon:yes stop_codon:yes gene_type:complete
MSNKKFKEPNITINKVYTRTGDSGDTSLVGGQRLPKDDIRIEAYGEVDELNAIIGGCKHEIDSKINQYSALKSVSKILYRIQHQLFNIGTTLATLPEDLNDDMPCIKEEDIVQLEKEMDDFNQNLPTLKSFVLPGGSSINIWLHKARTICRKTERRCVKLSKICDLDSNVISYLNRLSDALFVWSRWANHIEGCKENLWNPNYSSDD